MDGKEIIQDIANLNLFYKHTFRQLKINWHVLRFELSKL